MTAQDQETLRDFPFGDTALLSPHPEYFRLRAEEPVIRVRMPSGNPAWVFTRYEDVRTVMTDLRFGRAAATRPGTSSYGKAPEIAPSVFGMDPPEHTRIRKLIAGAFTARRVEKLRQKVREIVNERLEVLAAKQPPVDFIEFVSLPVPVTLMCEMFGVPYEDMEKFHRWSDIVITIAGRPAKEVIQAYTEFHDYLAALIDAKRLDPGDDLLSALVTAHDEKGSLSTEDLVSLGVALVITGHEATASQISNYVLALMHYRDQWDRLIANPDLVPTAVEELARIVQFGNTGGALIRVASEDVEIAGVTVKAGEAVIPGLMVANRDPDVFSEPNRLDIARKENPHMGFGVGVHHCPGAQLARVELQEVLYALIETFPTLRLAVDESELCLKTGLLVNSLKALPVTW
jgi:nocardicin N-oxygenase